MKMLSHNPDVLNCIANLSNDEVFTPPEIAAAMLDQVSHAWEIDRGESIWTNPNVKFIDPFTKSGVFLREITQRLVDGLSSQIPDLQKRVNHILTKQVHGIAITALTGMVARRSVYCSKLADGEHSICTEFHNGDGNIWFERVQHTWRGGKAEVRGHPTTGEDIKVYVNRRCKYCGASEDEYNRGSALETYAYDFIHTEDINQHLQEISGAPMRFDVVIGNPPYQLNDGGGDGSSATPIYQKFVTQAQALDPKYLSMIIPARWVTGGKGLTDFRKSMLNDLRIRSIVDYPDSREVFKNVDVAGGVCYFLWTQATNDSCEVTTRVRDREWSASRRLDEHEVFIRDNRALSIVRKVQSSGGSSLADLISARRPFNIDSSDDGDTNGDLYLFTARGDSRFSSNKLGEKGGHLVHTWRAMVSKSSSEHAGQTDKSGRKKVLSRLEIMPPGSVCTESYLVVGPFASEDEARNSIAFMKTRFARFLIQTVLLTQNITRKSFSMVPLVEFDRIWNDQMLYKKYGLTGEEIAFIESVVRPMEAD